MKAKTNDKMEKTEKCCICGKEIIGWGNNPAPVKNEGLCCDECCSKVVIPARYNQVINRSKK